MASMTAAVFAAPQEIELKKLPLPEPAPGEVRIRLEGCGVCASNLPVWEGRPWFEYPITPGEPGHEGWGVIDAVGRDVTNLKVGDRVTMLSYHAYATYDLAKAEAVIRLPESLDQISFPGEPLGCAMNIFRRSEIKAGQTVAIIGIGFLGALLTQLAAQAGARVIAISRRAYALEVAKQFGATETIAMDDHYQIIDQVKALTDDEGCDCVIEAVGKQWPLDLAAELTKVRGRLIVAGYHQDGSRQVNMQLWNWRGLDVINAHERDPGIYKDGMLAAVDATIANRLNPQPLYTHVFSLDQLPEAFRMMQDRPEGYLKALILL